MTESPRKILIATDAWSPQVNGVVRTLAETLTELQRRHHTVEVISPADFWRLPNPIYPEIELAVAARQSISRRMQQFRPASIHIATEGPIGQRVRAECLRRRWAFTTAYHTRFPEYLQTLMRVPESWGYALLKRFHDKAANVMVATPSLQAELTRRGFRAPLKRWSRGIDGTRFQVRPSDLKHPFAQLPRPLLLCVGRVSAEKNLAAFLALDTPGTKVVVGDGPARASLKRQFPAAHFTGTLVGEPLNQTYAEADLFVFPSWTDTFGLVVIEALASGLPVAAYPATGPIDIITRPELGALDADLCVAIYRALETGDRDACAAEGAAYTWERATDQFIANLVLIR